MTTSKNSSLWGEFLLDREQRLLPHPENQVPERIRELVRDLYHAADLPVVEADVLVKSDLAAMQLAADLANMMAKVWDEAFYDVKDWMIKEMIIQFGHTGRVAGRVSWGMREVEVTTVEAGVSSYHTYLWCEEMLAIPLAGDWVGITRQFATLHLLKDEKLLDFVSRMTRKLQRRSNDDVAERVNTLLDNYGKKYPLP